MEATIDVNRVLIDRDYSSGDQPKYIMQAPLRLHGYVFFSHHARNFIEQIL